MSICSRKLERNCFVMVILFDDACIQLIKESDPMASKVENLNGQIINIVLSNKLQVKILSI